jgi:hypothetical protein
VPGDRGSNRGINGSASAHNSSGANRRYGESSTLDNIGWPHVAIGDTAHTREAWELARALCFGRHHVVTRNACWKAHGNDKFCSVEPTGLKLTLEELLAVPADSDSEDDALAELDALTAELKATDPTELQREVHDHVAALLIDLDRGADQVHGPGPQGQPPHPVCPLDLGQHDVFSPQKVGSLIGQLREPTTCDQVAAGIVGLIVQIGGVGPGELTQHVKSIRTSYESGVPLAQVDQRYRPIIQGMTSGRQALTRLRTLVGEPSLAIPLPQASAVMCFYDAYPHFWTKLTNRISGFQFNSDTADAGGCGLFKNNTIYISNLPFTPPGAYVRLLVHEIGHAAFEKVLLNKTTMPTELRTDTVQSLQGPLTGSSGDSTWTVRNEECTKIRRYWKTMSPAAKIFYQSWRILRAQDGHHLLGTDMWQTRRSVHISVEARRKYQADSFDEFCAESFMLFAMGDLHSHVMALLTDNTVSVNVKTAWRNAWWILSMIAGPILAGHDL